MIPVRRTLAQLSYRAGKKEILSYMQELERLQWLSPEALLALQRRELLALLEYVNGYVPYYRDLFKRIGFQPADFAADPTTFEQLPLLTKADIRQHYEALITTEEERRSSLAAVKTGGTTGEPLWFQQDERYRNYNTAHDYHTMTWSGWQVGEPQFWLWGHQPAMTADRPASAYPEPVEGYKAALKEWLANRSGANAYVLTPESMEAFAQQIERQPRGLLWSYVSSTYRFAQFLQARGGHRLRLRAAFTAGEPLFESQREFIKEVLGCPVFNSYSSIDTGDIACECTEHNGLHLMSRNCYLEVVQEGQPVAEGEAGEFVLTTLTNYGMPLIRYKIEDWGRKRSAPCACGRGLPMLEVVEGRKIDLFKTRDGRTVYATFANKTMLTLGGVKQFQIIQKALDLIVFRIVQEGPIDPKKLQGLEQYTRETFGEPLEVKFEFVDSLPSSPTGKHRYLVSEVK